MTLRDQLLIDEGVRLKVYRCTAGKLSIAAGRNLDDVGISKAETTALGITRASCIAHGITWAQAMVLLDNDIARAKADLDARLPWWRTLDPARQDVLANMAFNMGIGSAGGRGKPAKGLLSFTNTLAAIKAGDWKAAAKGMRSSKWAGQVGARAERLAVIMEHGAPKEDAA